MEILNAIEKIGSLLKSRGVNKWDIHGSESSSNGIQLFEQKISNLEISHNLGLGIRVFVQGRPGYAWSESTRLESLESAVNMAIANAKLSFPLEFDLPHPSLHNVDTALLPPVQKGITELSTDEMLKFCLELEANVLDSDERITNMPYLGAEVSEGFSVLVNSNGIMETRNWSSGSCGAGAMAKEGEQTKLGYSVDASPIWSELDVTKLSKKCTSRSLELLGAKPIKSGSYDILLDKRIASQIVGMYLPSFYAESAQKGQSKLASLDRIGEKIASSSFSLKNNAAAPDRAGSSLWDGEGMPTQNTNIIQEGMFENFLYHLESAHKWNAKARGNASRGGSGRVGTAVQNLEVSKGQSSFKDLSKESDETLHIVKLEGSTGCSSVSGQLSIGAQGFLMKNGEVTQAVEAITLSGNFFDLIKNVKGVGDSWEDGFSGSKVPDLLVEGLNVSS